MIGCLCRPDARSNLLLRLAFISIICRSAYLLECRGRESALSNENTLWIRFGFRCQQTVSECGCQSNSTRCRVHCSGSFVMHTVGDELNSSALFLVQYICFHVLVLFRFTHFCLSSESTFPKWQISQCFAQTHWSMTFKQTTWIETEQSAFILSITVAPFSSFSFFRKEKHFVSTCHRLFVGTHTLNNIISRCGILYHALPRGDGSYFLE